MKSFPSKIKSLIFSDPLGKLFAMAMAVLLWYYVNVISVEKLYISLPVRLINVPEDVDIVPASELVTQVEITTHEDVSRRIEDLNAVIDLEDFQFGTNRYEITVQNLPNDIKARISPRYKTLLVYAISNKSVPVNIRIRPNSFLTNIEYSPESVTISGSERFLDEINEINTENLEFGAPTSPKLITNVSLIRPSNVALSPGVVRVELDFRYLNYTNDVFLPIEYKNVSPFLDVSQPQGIPLKIITTTTNIEELLLNTVISVDLEDFGTQGTYNVPVLYDIPVGVVLLQNPLSINVELKDLVGNSLIEASLEGLMNNITNNNIIISN